MGTKEELRDLSFNVSKMERDDLELLNKRIKESEISLSVVGKNSEGVILHFKESFQKSFPFKVILSIVDGRLFCSYREINEMLSYWSNQQMTEFGATALREIAIRDRPEWYVVCEKILKDIRSAGVPDNFSDLDDYINKHLDNKMINVERVKTL